MNKAVHNGEAQIFQNRSERLNKIKQVRERSNNNGALGWLTHER